MTEYGQRTEDGLGGALVARSGELAVAAGAAAAKAEVEAAYIVAMKQGRDWDQARQEIIRACNNSDFAEEAIGKRPVGGGKIWRELNIRFTEVALQAAKHMRVITRCIYSDEFSVVNQTSVTDLVNNQTYSKEFRLQKTVERHSAEGRDVVSERVNSKGQKTYIVLATEDELNNKSAAHESKILRSLGNRLIPAWIKADAKAACENAKIAKVKQDPEAYRRKLADAFLGLGISVTMLTEYLGHSLSEMPPDELADLRSLYEDLKDGECKWSDLVGAKRPEPETGTLDVDAMRPGTPPPPKDAPRRGRPAGSKNRPKESTPETSEISEAPQPVPSGETDSTPEGLSTTVDSPLPDAAEADQIRWTDIVNSTVIDFLDAEGVSLSMRIQAMGLLARHYGHNNLMTIAPADQKAALAYMESEEFRRELQQENILPMEK